ncbi:MAG: hypothetical protein GSR78_01775 [Desulfurococcales archaeon]|nr:hypothetical protein [Desulfurococcales archaeon]
MKLTKNSIIFLIITLLTITIIIPNTATAATYQNEYQSKLEVYNLAGFQVGYAIVGQVITIDTTAERITHATAGSMGAYATFPLWSAEWGNPWWTYDTTPRNSHAKVKIWQKISSPIWSEEGDLWNYVDYYGGNIVYVKAVIVGTSSSKSINLANTLPDVITIVLRR